ncbi:hypothetical protein Rhopal_004323-T1 [Rhodotorula paludigena]|uniref:Zn(2)-C6 fungal-type domain-containing protein n=1 Tax=Rhodotorula paludigena TaxID=86838 RepID=A0AAV5GN02_9BASI|nr:hypothetical protein Rhopal_004323-T1 [Rhodotorula paludigena]
MHPFPFPPSYLAGAQYPHAPPFPPAPHDGSLPPFPAYLLPPTHPGGPPPPPSAPSSTPRPSTQPPAVGNVSSTTPTTDTSTPMDHDSVPSHPGGADDLPRPSTSTSSSLQSPSPGLLHLDATPPAASSSDKKGKSPERSGSSTAAREPWIPPPPPPALSDPYALLERSRAALAQLIAQGNIDARPSRQGQASAPKSGACASCRAAKAKCSQDEPQCARCAVNHLECSYPVFNKRGRKRTLTPNMMALQNCHRDLDAAFAILAATSQQQQQHQHQRLPPSSSSSAMAHLGPHAVASSSSTLAVPPSHAPPHAHPAAASSVSGSSSAHDTPDEDDAHSRALKSVIESPLAVLAHISSLKVGEDADADNDVETGKTFLPLRGKGKARAEAGGKAMGYFATGLYQLRSDADPAQDPVALGILTAEEFERTVEFYFAHLRQFSFHLSPSLHTPQFLRDVSPFLSTAIAFLCASYLPDLRHLVPALHAHTLRLSDRVWSEGLKSLEIVQAFLLLINWTPIEDDWGDDRRWSWLGETLRIATEIKLYRALNAANYDFYRSVTPLGDGAYQELADSRAWSWKLLFVTEIALCVSTGRVGSVHTLSLSTPGEPIPQNLDKDHPCYNMAALVALNKIYSKAIAHSNSLQDEKEGHESRHRPAFQKAWSSDITAWRNAWPHINALVRLIAQHDNTIVTSISLRFKGPVWPVLEECRHSALETARMAVKWEDGELRYATNVVVVLIAYAATLLLRVIAAKPGPSDSETKMLCAKVADALIEAGSMRPTVRNLATLHGTRIRALLQADYKHGASIAPTPAGTAPSSPQLQASNPPAPADSSAFPALPSACAFPLTNAHLLPTQALLQAQEQGFAYPVIPGVFNLPLQDSHLLWDIAHEARLAPPPALGNSASARGGTAAAAADLGGAGMGLEPAQAQAQLHAGEHAAAAAAAAAASAAAAAEAALGPSSSAQAEDTGLHFDDWMYKSALDTDWLSSEPGAWAW